MCGLAFTLVFDPLGGPYLARGVVRDLARRIEGTMKTKKLLTLGIFAGALSFGCSADDNDPATHVKYLDDAAKKEAAIDRLSQFFEGAMSRNNNKTKSPDVQKVIEVAAAPLAKTYVAGGLDEKTRKKLIKLLSDMRDNRATPAYVKALKEYSKGGEEDLRASADALENIAEAGDTVDPAAKEALWEGFSKYSPSAAHMAEPTKSLMNAILRIKDPAYGPKALEALAKPVSDSPDSQLDEVQFHQLVALRTIKELHYGAAADNVVKVMLSPAKAGLGATANATLMAIPKEAEASLLKAFNGDAAFKDLVAAAPNGLGNIIVADSISWISRPAGKAAILGSLAKTTDDTERGAYAQQVTRFPADANLGQGFRAAYTKFAPGLKLEKLSPPVFARAIWIKSASYLFDPTLVPMILKEVGGTKGDSDESAMMQNYGLDTITKLMDKSQLADAEKVVKKIYSTKEQEMYNASAKIVTQCDKDAACYAKVLDEPVQQTPASVIRATKAAWMAGVYGNAETKKALVAKVDKIKQRDVRQAVVEVVDRLAPAGDADTASAFDKIVEADVKTGNKALIEADDAVVKVAQRLRARALP